MNAVKKKLKSQRGASAVIALMFFVVASAVGAIVLSSASANAGRATHALSDQQEYYAVESALKLITDDFASGEMRFPAEEDAEPSGDAAQKHILKIEDFVFSETEDSIHYEVKKSVSIVSDDCPGMPEVSGTLTLQYTKQKEDDDSNLYSFLTNSTTTKKKVDALKLSDNLKLVLDIGVQIDPENEDLQSNRVIITYLPIVTAKTIYKQDPSNPGDVEPKLVTTISWYQQKMERGVSAENG